MAMKAREVREILKKVNVDPKLKYILEGFAEEIYMQHKAIKELAVMLDQFATIVNGMHTGLVAQANAIDKTEKRLDGTIDPELKNHVTK